MPRLVVFIWSRFFVTENSVVKHPVVRILLRREDWGLKGICEVFGLWHGRLWFNRTETAGKQDWTEGFLKRPAQKTVVAFIWNHHGGKTPPSQLFFSHNSLSMCPSHSSNKMTSSFVSSVPIVAWLSMSDDNSEDTRWLLFRVVFVLLGVSPPVVWSHFPKIISILSPVTQVWAFLILFWKTGHFCYYFQKSG